MTIRLGQNGYPELYEDKVNLGTVSIDPDTKSGNPFHNPATGEFTFAPAGMQVLEGENLLKGLSTSTRKIFFNRSAVTKANQVVARIINGNLQIVLLRDGRKLDSFAVAPKSADIQKARAIEAKGSPGAQLEQDAIIRDAAVDAVRQGIENADELHAFLRSRNISLSGGVFAQIQELMKGKRLDDLVDYLHQTLLKKHHKENQVDRVRISVGRGFLKRTFAGLDKGETQKVLERLQGRGWTENTLQGTIVTQFPPRLKKIFSVPEKEQIGKKELRKARRKNSVGPNSN